MTLYTTDSCPKCKMIKQMLDENGYQYDIETNVSKALAAGINVVPVMVLQDGTRLNPKQIITICKAGGTFE